MRDINQYINEVFKLRDDTKIMTDPTKDPKMRPLSGDKIKLYNGRGKQFTIPNRIWYVYKDKYRGNILKIECYMNLAMSIAYAQDDYEDFGPQDILYATNNIKDGLFWIAKTYIHDKNDIEYLKDMFNHADEYSKDYWCDKFDELMRNSYSTSFCNELLYDVLTDKLTPSDMCTINDEGHLENKVDTFEKFKNHIAEYACDWDDYTN